MKTTVSLPLVKAFKNKIVAENSKPTVDEVKSNVDPHLFSKINV